MKIDGVLDLVGNSVMLDSLVMLRRGGRSCLAGWLGGLDPIRDFNPLLQMASGVYLTFFASFVFGTPGTPFGRATSANRCRCCGGSTGREAY
jgi:NADPH:quinone reductase